jgi:hypothetical protein
MSIKMGWLLFRALIPNGLLPGIVHMRLGRAKCSFRERRNLLLPFQKYLRIYMFFSIRGEYPL